MIVSEFENTANVTQITSLISSLIKDEWEAIDGYNQAIVTLSTMEGNEDLIKTFNDILSEEYIHIGQLEKSLEMLIPEASNMEKGQEEAQQDTIEQAIEQPILKLPEQQDVQVSEVEEPVTAWPEDDLTSDQVAYIVLTEK